MRASLDEQRRGVLSNGERPRDRGKEIIKKSFNDQVIRDRGNKKGFSDHVVPKNRLKRLKTNILRTLFQKAEVTHIVNASESSNFSSEI